MSAPSEVFIFVAVRGIGGWSLSVRREQADAGGRILTTNFANGPEGGERGIPGAGDVAKGLTNLSRGLGQPSQSRRQ